MREKKQHCKPYSFDIITKAIKTISPLIYEWRNDPKFCVEDVESDLHEVISQRENDGYEIAQNLEMYRNYKPDAKLVAILSTFNDLVESISKE